MMVTKTEEGRWLSRHLYLGKKKNGNLGKD